MTRNARRRLAAVAGAAALGTLAGCGGPAVHEPPGEEVGPGSTAEAAPEKRRGFSLFATGDLLVHDTLIRQARADAGGSGYDFHKMLAGAKPMAEKADLAICHMETVYGADGGPFTGYPAFQTPPQLAEAVKDTGYDSCSTASNHTLDAGPAGVERTLKAMDETGLGHVGSARSEAESTRPATMRAGGAEVAQLSYTYGVNGEPPPKDKPWLVNMIEPGRILADARAARRDGADVVVVSMHWGTEWQEAPDALQRSVAEKLTASRTGGRRDIDLVLGTHAHVPQPFEKLNGTWVVYGMGDQLAGKMSDPRGTTGTAARFRFVPPEKGDRGEWRVKKAEFIPYLMETEPRHSLVELGAGRETGDARHDRVRDAVSRATLSRGAAGDGLRMGG